MKLPSAKNIELQVQQAIEEDVGLGDLTAQLVPINLLTQARIITREAAIMCGIAWADEVFRQIDPQITAVWKVNDGEQLAAQQLIGELKGPARSLLTAERIALNFLQLLSGTATITRQYVEQLKDTNTQLLDTRKTLPGLRLAQKYAVCCGSGHNHRFGLYDAYLIKENHIASCGSITKAVQTARKLHPDKKIEVEVENLEQLQEALAVKVPIIMLDNFDLPLMKKAVEINAGRAKLEVSGNVSLENIRAIAATGIDYISVGALTKHVSAVDLSLRLISHKGK